MPAEPALGEEYCQTLKTSGTLAAAERCGDRRIRVVGSGRVVALRKSYLTLGTARDNDMVLDDPYISKHHASLALSDCRIWLQDEGSRNGTWADGRLVQRCEVGPGTRIVLGHTSLVLEGEDGTAAPSGLVGEHATMQRVCAQIQRFGPSVVPVLIQGETGTGKELVARALHAASSCPTGPFEPLNCGAIPRELAESELFGHAQGAFTGATRQRQGAFEHADGGTLFLDEVGEMPLELQAKILRVLEEGHIQRIGEGTRRPVAVRIIAATNRELVQEAGRCRFRLDLYHRLAVAVIHIPPLRERVEDIPLLVRHFLKQCAGSGPPVKVDYDVLQRLRQHLWPGNVRELRNVIWRATVEGGARLRVSDLAFLSEPAAAAPPGEVGWVRYLERPFGEVRREIYLGMLRHHRGNRTAAATALGIPKSTFFDQLRSMGL